MIFNTVESFHKKGFFYLGCKKLMVINYSKPNGKNACDYLKN